MSRKIDNLSIDGVGVDVSRARFADTFDVVESDERSLAFDEEVVYVVVARVAPPSFRSTKNGDVSRVNVLKVIEARLLRGDKLSESVLEKLGFDYRPTFLGEEPTAESEPEPSTMEDEYGDPAEWLAEEGESPLPPEDEDEEMSAWLAAMKELGAGFENEPDDFEPMVDGDRKIVGRSISPAVEKDPVLANFLR